MEAQQIGALPGDTSEITRKLAELTGQYTTPEQQKLILSAFFAWGDANRVRGIARNRVLNVANAMRAGGERPLFVPPTRGEFTLVSLLGSAASPQEPTKVAAVPLVVQPAPESPKAPQAEAPKVTHTSASPATELVQPGTIHTPVALRAGKVPLGIRTFTDETTGRNTYLDEYVATGEHPFVRLGRVGDKLFVFAGSCRGPLPAGEDKGKLANVNFRVRGASAADLRAESSSRELLGGMVFWVWSFPWVDGEPMRFWLNLAQPGHSRGKDVAAASVRLVLAADGYVCTSLSLEGFEAGEHLGEEPLGFVRAHRAEEPLSRA